MKNSGGKGDESTLGVVENGPNDVIEESTRGRKTGKEEFEGTGVVSDDS